VETRKVELADFEQTVDEEGKTRVRDRYLVAAPAAGLLERIALKAGDPVEAGAVVAVLRPTLPALRDARTTAELRERVEVAQAHRLAADAQVGEARAALDLARLESERADSLAARGFLSKALQDDARLKLQRQAQTLKAAEFEQQAAQHELAVARATLAQSDPAAKGQSRLARIEVRAPVSGRVLRVVEESEAAVALGDPLLEVGDPGSLEAVVEVLSQDALRIAPGMPARLSTSPGLPPLRGSVRRVEPSGRTKISTLGVEEQRVNVIVDLDAAAPIPVTLGDGYRVDASIVVLARAEVPVVPVGALFRDGERWAVFVVDGRNARKRNVELGARNQHSAWVVGGLQRGETVIVYPPDTVADGVEIRPR
jgi:HlyD family secretion protein